MRIKIVGDCGASRVLRGYLRKSDSAIVTASSPDYTVHLEEDDALDTVCVDSIDCQLERNTLNLIQELGVPEFILKRAEGIQSDAAIKITYPSRYQRQVELGVYRALTHENISKKELDKRVNPPEKSKLRQRILKTITPMITFFMILLIAVYARSEDNLPKGFIRTYPILFQPTNFPVVRFWDGTTIRNATFTGGSLNINCTGGCGGAASFADSSAFTFGTTAVNNMGAVVDDVGTNVVAENSAGAPRMNGNRILYFNPRNNAGTEIPFPAALGAGGGFKVEGSGTPLSISTAWPFDSTGGMEIHGEDSLRLKIWNSAGCINSASRCESEQIAARIHFRRKNTSVESVTTKIFTADNDRAAAGAASSGSGSFQFGAAGGKGRTVTDADSPGTACAISNITIANPTVVTSCAHGFTTGAIVLAFITGTNSTPNINGLRYITITGATTYTVPVNVTGAGNAGSHYSSSTVSSATAFFTALDPGKSFTLSTGGIPCAGNAVEITANSLANPTQVTTRTAHGLVSGNYVSITGSNSTPNIDGLHIVTFVDATHYTIPVNVGTAGTTGISGDNPCQGPKFPTSVYQGHIVALLSATTVTVSPSIVVDPAGTATMIIEPKLLDDADGTELGDGTLIKYDTNFWNTGQKVGQTFVESEINKGPWNMHMGFKLTCDFMETSFHLSWSGGTPVCRHKTETPGWNYAYVLGTTAGSSAPAAGSDWIVTVPTNTQWEVEAISALFTTGNVTINRLANITIDDGANVIYTIPGNTMIQTASTTYGIYAATGATAGSVLGPTGVWLHTLTLPFPLKLEAGWRIRSATTNLQSGGGAANDAYSSVVITRIERPQESGG